MNIFTNLSHALTKNLETWLNQHLRAKQWLWFIVLWLLGLLSVVILTYPLKFLINHLK